MVSFKMIPSWGELKSHGTSYSLLNRGYKQHLFTNLRVFGGSFIALDAARKCC